METTCIPRLFVRMIPPAPANLNAGTGDFASFHKYHRRMICGDKAATQIVAAREMVKSNDGSIRAF